MIMEKIPTNIQLSGKFESIRKNKDSTKVAYKRIFIFLSNLRSPNVIIVRIAVRPKNIDKSFQLPNVFEIAELNNPKLKNEGVNNFTSWYADIISDTIIKPE